MIKKWVVVVLLMLTGSSFVLSLPAHADFTASALLGYSSGSGEGHTGLEKGSIHYGLDVAYGLEELLQIGAFFEQNSVKVISTQETGPLTFYGILARMGFITFPMFLDAKVGFEHISVGALDTDTAVGFGVGTGYNIPVLPTIAIRPRIGYRYLPVKSGRSTLGQNSVDFGILASFSL